MPTPATLGARVSWPMRRTLSPVLSQNAASGAEDPSNAVRRRGLLPLCSGGSCPRRRADCPGYRGEHGRVDMTAGETPKQQSELTSIDLPSKVKVANGESLCDALCIARDLHHRISGAKEAQAVQIEESATWCDTSTALMSRVFGRTSRRRMPGAPVRLEVASKASPGILTRNVLSPSPASSIPVVPTGVVAANEAPTRASGVAQRLVVKWFGRNQAQCPHQLYAAAGGATKIAGRGPSCSATQRLGIAKWSVDATSRQSRHSRPVPRRRRRPRAAMGTGINES